MKGPPAARVADDYSKIQVVIFVTIKYT
jgi:hypothetical protein